MVDRGSGRASTKVSSKCIFSMGFTGRVNKRRFGKAEKINYKLGKV